MSRFIRLLVVAFTLIALLGAPLASEAAPRLGAGRATAPLSWLWSFLAQAWEKAGCRIDPDGLCVPGSQETADEGCRIDPNGGCAPEASVNTKEGCRIDPSGGCLLPSPVTTENGCSLDPFDLCASGN